MNTTTTTYHSRDASGATRTIRPSRLLVAAALISAVIVGMGNLSKGAPPETIESQFAEAVHPLPVRLKSAREAAKRGDHELAIHDYLASIQEDATTADSAIGEMVAVFLSIARTNGAEGRYVDQSAQIGRCHQALVQLKQVELTTKALSEPARTTLFQEIARVRSVGNKAAQGHICTAYQLRKEAKGRHWWNSDNQDMQMQSLHRVNLAWSYYPVSCDEQMVDAMYEIWADMKGELSSWRYSQVMERDRLHFGRVVGDR